MSSRGIINLIKLGGWNKMAPGTARSQQGYDFIGQNRTNQIIRQIQDGWAYFRFAKTN